MSSLGFGALLAIFVAAGAATWVAGGYLSRATDVLDDRFNLGEAVGGMLLLGLAGSLPELAITASAALSGHLALATGNLLGGIAMQTLVLVLLDAASGRPRPLYALVANTSPLNQAGLVIGLVTLAIMGGILPESTAIGPVSPMSLAIVVYFALGMVAINRARQVPAVWRAADVFASQSFAERGFVDPAAARRRLERHRRGDLDAGFELWRALNLELWAGTFLDCASSS